MTQQIDHNYIDEKRSAAEFLSKTRISRSQIIDQKPVVSRFSDQKRAISEREKLIKEENLCILWSNPSNSDIRCCCSSTLAPLFYCEIRASALKGTTCEGWSDIWTEDLILAVNLNLI